MAAIIETYKPAQESLATKEPRPKRDFLREHREYLRKIQKSQRTAKMKSSAKITTTSELKDPSGNVAMLKRHTEETRKDTWKSAAFNRLTAIADRNRPLAEKRLATFISRGMDSRKRAGEIYGNLRVSDQFVQTYDNVEEAIFLEGAKLLAPSDFILEAIRANTQPPVEPKPKPIKRRVDRHTCVLNAHLSDLKEFLEKGSVSRRKRCAEAPKNPSLQKFLVRGRRASRPNIESEAKRVPTEVRIIDNVKSSILFGSQGQTEMKSSPVQAKLPKLSKKESIGDGPKRSGDNKLIVVYQ